MDVIGPGKCANDAALRGGDGVTALAGGEDIIVGVAGDLLVGEEEAAAVTTAPQGDNWEIKPSPKRKYSLTRGDNSGDGKCGQ